MKLIPATRLIPATLRAAAAALTLALLGAPALAQNVVPSPELQETIIKSALLTFNDANVTGNYAVMHAKLSKRSRDQITPAKLAEVFKAWRDRHIFIYLIAAKAPIASEPPKFDNDGQLRLKGYFDANGKQVVYDLGFFLEDGAWKVATINPSVRDSK